MACQTFSILRTASIETLLAVLSLNFSEVDLQAHINTIMDDHPNTIQQELAELLYYHIGSELAAKQDWDTMTFLQLEREARVQGILVPTESHQYTAFRLKLLLKFEAERLEEAQVTTLPETSAYVNTNMPARQQSKKSEQTTKPKQDPKSDRSKATARRHPQPAAQDEKPAPKSNGAKPSARPATKPTAKVQKQAPKKIMARQPVNLFSSLLGEIRGASPAPAVTKAPSAAVPPKVVHAIVSSKTAPTTTAPKPMSATAASKMTSTAAAPKMTSTTASTPTIAAPQVTPTTAAPKVTSATVAPKETSAAAMSRATHPPVLSKGLQTSAPPEAVSAHCSPTTSAPPLSSPPTTVSAGGPQVIAPSPTVVDTSTTDGVEPVSASSSSPTSSEPDSEAHSTPTAHPCLDPLFRLPMSGVETLALLSIALLKRVHLTMVRLPPIVRFFFAAQDELRFCSVKELLEETDLLHMNIDHARRWEQYPLRFEIITKLARDAVANWNNLRRAGAVAQDISVRKSRRSDNPKMKKIHEEEQQFYAEKRRQKKDTKPQGNGDQNRDSGYSTSNNPSTSPSSLEDSEDEDRPLDRSKERITTRRGDRQGKSNSPVESKEKDQLKSRKRASPYEGCEDEHLSKKAKVVSEENRDDVATDATSPPPEPQRRTKVEVEKEIAEKGKKPTKTAIGQSETDVLSSSEEEAPQEAPKKLNKRKSRSSEDDDDSDELSSKMQKINEKRKKPSRKAPANKKIIVTEAEKVKGVSYISLGDGKYELRKSARAKFRAKQPSPPSNTIDPAKFLS
ncbi:hypothetical protein CC86DRAFT_432411 [Ophiobolus disseminans]|uniref:Uncharacterized protein n=1 Tax=Ophiobolus disseminans TaxID=1469910 RepID=A0A6A6ZFL9_9PLEO|nr:hypothetical protein CC86DRAFT_432411 [Ophiobolus disseminans]